MENNVRTMENKEAVANIKNLVETSQTAREPTMYERLLVHFDKLKTKHMERKVKVDEAVKLLEEHPEAAEYFEILNQAING